MSEPGKQPYLLDIAPLLALLWESPTTGVPTSTSQSHARRDSVIELIYQSGIISHEREGHLARDRGAAQ